MARACKVVGTVLVILGLVTAVTFVVMMARDDTYRRAAVAFSHNPGNVMYEAEFRGAQVRRGFELVGALAGVLFAANGGTLVGLGVVASRGRG